MVQKKVDQSKSNMSMVLVMNNMMNAQAKDLKKTKQKKNRNAGSNQTAKGKTISRSPNEFYF